MKTTSSSHAVHSLGYHIIWCPKYRHTVLEGFVAAELKKILAETCTTYKWLLQEIEVRLMPYLHVIINITRT